MTEQQALPLGTGTLCGYCLRPLTQQPEGDWACSPCRWSIKELITASEYDDQVRQFAAFQRRARRRDAIPPKALAGGAVNPERSHEWRDRTHYYPHRRIKGA